MTDKLRTEVFCVYSPTGIHRHTQIVFQLSGRGHPNALISVGKVPERSEISQGNERCPVALYQASIKMFAGTAQTLDPAALVSALG
jgi:hypothetical protein